MLDYELRVTTFAAILQSEGLIASRHPASVPLPTLETFPLPSFRQHSWLTNKYSQTDQPVPLIPPPPPPLNIAPSRARRRLADRLALHKQQQAQEASASGIDPNDPFASLGDNDDNDATDPFSLDEDEQDITASGNRNKTSSFPPSSENSAGFSVTRGLTSLFSQRREENFGHDDLDNDKTLGVEDSSSEDDSEEGNSSEENSPEQEPLEARRSLERQPLDVDDDEEMGEMVAPTDDSEEERKANSSDEEDMISPMANERRRSSLGQPDPDLLKTKSPMRESFDLESEEKNAEFQDEESGSSGEEGDELVEISMPVSVGDGRRNSMGRG